MKSIGQEAKGGGAKGGEAKGGGSGGKAKRRRSAEDDNDGSKPRRGSYSSSFWVRYTKNKGKELHKRFMHKDFSGTEEDAVSIATAIDKLPVEQLNFAPGKGMLSGLSTLLCCVKLAAQPGTGGGGNGHKKDALEEGLLANEQ